MRAQKGYHEHDGFYLSMSIGPLFGNIMDNVTGIHGPYTTEFTGTGAQFDFKIGGAIGKNLILHATLTDDFLPGPKVTTTQGGYSVSTKTSDSFSIGESMLGVGMTYYLMPSNIFFSSTIGLGNFSTMDSEDSSKNFTTENGISTQFKLGKEWWISKNWGFGLGLIYGKTYTTNDTGEEMEKLNSNRFGILFNTTFN